MNNNDQHYNAQPHAKKLKSMVLLHVCLFVFLFRERKDMFFDCLWLYFVQYLRGILVCF
jgi:hypothetical protein